MDKITKASAEIRALLEVLESSMPSWEKAKAYSVPISGYELAKIIPYIRTLEKALWDTRYREARRFGATHEEGQKFADTSICKLWK